MDIASRYGRSLRIDARRGKRAIIGIEIGNESQRGVSNTSEATGIFPGLRSLRRPGQGRWAYSMNRVLITGGNGFIGSHLADRLQGLGDSVTLFDTHFTSDTARL